MEVEDVLVIFLKEVWKSLHIDVFWIRVKGRYNSKFRGFTITMKLMKIKPLRKFSTITVIGIRHSSYIQIYMYM